jgi:hypothetical protein
VVSLSTVFSLPFVFGELAMSKECPIKLENGLPLASEPIGNVIPLIGQFLSMADFQRWDTLRLSAAKGAGKSSGKMTLKVSRKGAISVYGLGRFPVTLYASQFEKLLVGVTDRAANPVTAFIDSKPVTDWPATEATATQAAQPAVKATLKMGDAE